MPYTYGGVEYLNAKESAEYLDISYNTFQNMEQQYNLSSFSIPGKGRRRFFKKSDLDKLREPRPSDDDQPS